MASPDSRTARWARAGVRRLREWTRAGGAGESGLDRLYDVHAAQSAGDAILAVALAGTLFFGVPVGEARGKVALYLLVTMAPFAVVAPVIGPVLDHVRHGRRTAITVTMLARALLAVGVAKGIAGSDPFALYPAAFGVLVASKAYAVARNAAVPRLLPGGASLVQANSRLSLAGLVPGLLAGAVGAGVVKVFGAPWALRLAVLAYVVAAVLALRLPAQVDSPPLLGGRRPRVGELLRLPRRPIAGAPAVRGVLRAAAALRALSGFLILFIAFLVRAHPVGMLHGTVGLGVLALGATAGGLAGTWLGARIRGGAPETITTVVLAVATACCLLTAWRFEVVTVLVVSLVAAGAQALSKLSLDATIQRDVDETVQTSTFAWTDTLLQLAWVAGGAVGLALPVGGTWGFALAGGALAVVLVATLWFVHQQRGRRGRAAVTPAR